MYLFLDDERMPEDVTWVKLPCPEKHNSNWNIVRNYGKFCTSIEYLYKHTGYLPRFISFDHDLGRVHYVNAIKGLPANHGTDEKTGMDCAKWLVEFCLENNLDFPEYICHSQNPIGKENIVGLIESFKRSHARK